MRAFITGISGFVGPHLAAHLAAHGDQVLGSSLSGRPGEQVGPRPPVFPAGTQLVAWDLTRGVTAEIHAALTQFAPQAIYHLAAISAPRDCGGGEPTDAAVAVNVGGTAAVVELAATLPSRPRLLLVSTSHVYAAVSADQPRVAETAAIGPPSAYGQTKWRAEQLVRQAVEQGSLDAVIARAFKHTGPGQSPQFMLPEWARQFARRSSEPVHVQCLDSYLDLCDVRDVVRAYRLLVERGARGQCYNVASGTMRRSGDLFANLRQLADPERPFVETRPGRRQEPIGDIGQLQAATGWSPRVPIETTLRDVWDDWRHSAAGGADS